MNKTSSAVPAGIRASGNTTSAGQSPVILITPATPSLATCSLTLGRQQLLRTQRSTLQLAAALGLRVIVSPVLGAHGAVDTPDTEMLCRAMAKPELLPRPSPDALQCAALFSAIDRSPNRFLVLAGVVTEVEIYLTALTALRRGFEVHVLVDACAGADPRAEAAALQTLAAQGVRLTNLPALMAQLLQDVTTPHAAAVAEMVRMERQGVTTLSRPEPLELPHAAG